jgi:hypothetical protein
VFLSGQAGPAILAGKKHKHHILFERYSAAYTKKAFTARNMHHIQPTHHSPATAAFHPSIRPRLMLADAGFLNHVQAGRPAG